MARKRSSKESDDRRSTPANRGTNAKKVKAGEGDKGERALLTAIQREAAKKKTTGPEPAGKKAAR